MAASLNSIEQLLRADRVLVTTTTPWTVEYRDEDTGVVLMTKKLKNTAGENIITKENILGSLTKL